MTVAARPWWPWLKRVLTWAFFAVVAVLIVDYARGIDWSDVRDAIVQLPRTSIALAVALTTCSFALYSAFDLLGRHMVGHRLGTAAVMGVTFVAYAFGLNLGSLVGAIALRFRLYSRLGLDNDAITKVTAFSMLTNWFGYLAIAGAAYCFGSIRLPPDWKIDSAELRIVGVVLMGLAVGYLVLCAVVGRRVWHIRGRTLETPSLRMGLLQLAMAAGNWALMGGVMWMLMPTGIGYAQVLAVLLVGAVAGLISHVPAGLGVLEAVYIALLGHQVPQGRLIGAVLAYRAIYYLLPLVFATGFYLATEYRARSTRHDGHAA